MTTDWFDDESFWEAVDPFLFTRQRLAAAEREVELLLELVDLDGRNVLDLACGTGRHAVELARRGYQVTAVDRSRYLLGKAEAAAASAEVSVEWIRADMREFVRPGTFDLAINMFTSFGYFDDPADDLRVLINLHSSLRDGGCLLIDLIGKEHVAEVFQPAAVDEAADGALLVQRREIFDDYERIRNQWTVVRGGEVRSFRFHHTLYSARELKDRLGAAGFRSTVVFGDLEGSAYGPGSERLVAVATR